MRLVHVTTVPQTLVFFRGQVRYLQERGVEVTVVSSPGLMLRQMATALGATYVAVPMHRRISPIADVASVIGLVRAFRRLRPDIVHGHTPKGGLLAMIAAVLARVPVRIYHVHGLPFETETGARRRIMMATEKISCRLADRVFCVSRSGLVAAQREHILAPGEGGVLAAGSINGVDARVRFNPDTQRSGGRALREELGIPGGADVVGYVGRVVRSKGIEEVTSAWARLSINHPDAHLLIVGPAETEDPVPASDMEALTSDARVHLIGWVDDPAPYYAAMDVLVLPSHREGFGVVAIEAAAMELPVVATRITGIVDAVDDEVTGRLIPLRDPSALAEAVESYFGDSELRRAHGAAGRKRALESFDPETIWRALFEEYAGLLAAARRRPTRGGRLVRRRPA